MGWQYTTIVCVLIICGTVLLAEQLWLRNRFEDEADDE